MIMSLTLESEQRLTKVNLVVLHDQSKPKWGRLVKQSYQFVAKNFPDGATIRMDDVAKALVPLLEVHEELQNALSQKKLKQKYWIRDFGDLILDRAWDTLGD